MIMPMRQCGRVWLVPVHLEGYHGTDVELGIALHHGNSVDAGVVLANIATPLGAEIESPGTVIVTIVVKELSCPVVALLPHGTGTVLVHSDLSHFRPHCQPLGQ